MHLAFGGLFGLLCDRWKGRPGPPATCAWNDGIMSRPMDGKHLVSTDDRDSATGRKDGLRLAGVLLLGTLAFVGLFVSAYATRPTLTLNLTGDSRATLRNFYAAEHLDALSWVWTRSHAELSLPSLDRRVTWRWSSRVLLNRPADIPPPTVRITFDDVVAFEGMIVQDSLLEFAIPQAPDLTGVVLTFDTTPGFVPGLDDPRELGIALASMSLRAERGSASEDRGALLRRTRDGRAWGQLRCSAPATRRDTRRSTGSHPRTSVAPHARCDGLWGVPLRGCDYRRRDVAWHRTVRTCHR